MYWKTGALIVAVAIAFGSGASAAIRITPPAVPDGLEVEGGFKPFLVGHAIGTQNYVCAPAATPSGTDWLFIGPQATVFNASTEQILTHYQSKNPLKNDALHATWQHSRDTSAVWALPAASSTDPAFVTPGAIPWLLLSIVGAQEGPTGGDALTGTTYIQRVNTVAGGAPATGCAAAGDIGKRVFVPYETDYVFYKARP
jgi:hypothetical protein